jgi:AI-2 transport protein TqsA
MRRWCRRKDTDTSHGTGEKKPEDLPYGDSMSTSQPPALAASEAEASPPVRPALPRSVIVLLGAFGVVVVAAGIKGAAGIIAPAMLSLALTIAVLPIGAWARRHGWPGWLATLTALVAAYAILFSLLAGTVICLVKLVNLLPQYAGQSKDGTDQIDKWMSSLGISGETTTDALKKIDPSTIVNALTDVLGGIFGAAGSLFFLVTVMFFFVTAVPGFGPRMAALSRSKPELASSLGRFVTGTQRYLVMTALFGAIVAVLDTGALWLLGVPLALVWGFFSFITNFIPNIGFVIGVIPPALLALLDGGWQQMLLVILVYSALNVTIQTFIQPRYVGASVGLSAEMTFLSLVVWTFLLGALGALLAVPMTLLVRALFIDSDKRAAWVTPLIGTSVEEERADPAPAARSPAAGASPVTP